MDYELETSRRSWNAPPWSPRDVGWGLGLAVLWICILGIVGTIVQYIGLSIDPSAIIVFGTLLLLVPVWYLTMYKYGASWADLGLRRFELRDLAIGAGLMIISFLFNLVYASFLGIFGLQIQPDIGPVFDTTAFPLLLLFGGAIIAPIVEEVFFRGFVFAGLRKRWNWRAAAVISAGVFAVAHLVPTSILPIFILGFIFAFLYQLSGSIWPAILMHMLTNTLALTGAYAISQGWGG